MSKLRNSSLSFLVSHPFISFSPHFSISISLYICLHCLLCSFQTASNFFFLITFYLRVYSCQTRSSHCFQTPGTSFSVIFFRDKFPICIPPSSFILLWHIRQPFYDRIPSVLITKEISLSDPQPCLQVSGPTSLACLVVIANQLVYWCCHTKKTPFFPGAQTSHNHSL